jgi:hypothetical protein
MPKQKRQGEKSFKSLSKLILDFGLAKGKILCLGHTGRAAQSNFPMISPTEVAGGIFGSREGFATGSYDRMICIF